MEIQVDIINRLVQHHMIFNARDIFFLLDFRSLRNCELVSKSWYFAIRNDNIWKRRYHREEMKRPHFVTEGAASLVARATKRECCII
jgi:hypothetical protein